MWAKYEPHQTRQHMQLTINKSFYVELSRLPQNQISSYEDSIRFEMFQGFSDSVRVSKKF